MMLDSPLYKGKYTAPRNARKSWKVRKWTDFETFVIVFGYAAGIGLGVAVFVSAALGLALGQ